MKINKLFAKKKFKAFAINCKITYYIFLLIILVQFMLVSIIFLQNKKSKYLTEQTSFRVASVANKQEQLNKKLDTLQSGLSRVQVQLYRLNSQNAEQQE